MTTVSARIEGKVDALANRFQEIIVAQDKRDTLQDNKISAHDKIMDGNGKMGLVAKVEMLWEARNDQKSLRYTIWGGIIMMVLNILVTLFVLKGNLP